MHHESVYDILGLAENAGPDDVKKAYRRLAIKWHPGHGTGQDESAADQFRRAASAFKVLSDPTLRLAYDRKMREAARATAGGAPSPMLQPPLVSFRAATTLFFEQLLDQAFELAARGFNERAITRVLEGLGCTEKEALTAAATAVRSLSSGGSAPEPVVAAQDDYPPTVFVPLHHEPLSQPRANDRPFDIDTASWEEAMPYYEAVIVGNDLWRALSEEEAASISGKRSKFFVISAIVGFVLGILVGKQLGNTAGLVTAAIVGPLVAFTLALWVEGWLIRDVDTYLADKKRKYYLDNFEKLHNKSASWSFSRATFFGGMFWFSYRRMPFYSAVWTAVVLAFAIAQDYMGIKGSSPVNAGLWIALGISGMPCYVKHAKAAIRKVMSRPADVALASLREIGGVNRWSWSIQFVLYFVIYMTISGQLGVAF